MEDNPNDSAYPWALVHKVWRGWFGWKGPEFLGVRAYDTSFRFFRTKKKAIAAARKLGCACCDMPPTKMRTGKTYNAGYADKVKIIQAPKPQKRRK